MKIEKENTEFMHSGNVTVSKESGLKTVNYSTIQSTRNPFPSMYFPDSNVTINYHFHK